MATLPNLQSLTKDQLIALLAAAQAQPARKLTLKVTAPKLDPKTNEMKGSTGAIAMYGLGRFPVTLYRSQWERLLDEADAIRAFIKTNEALLAARE